MQIKNPNFLNAEQARLVKYGALIDAYISGLPNNVEVIDVDTIIADVLAMPEIIDLGLTDADVTPAKIANICALKGIRVEP